MVEIHSSEPMLLTRPESGAALIESIIVPQEAHEGESLAMGVRALGQKPNSERTVGTLRTTVFTAAAFLGIVAGPVAAQPFPTQPVRIVVPSAAGGGFDFVGRLLAEHLSRHVGGSFVVENIVGAGSLVGTRAVAKFAPDGYGLLTAGLSNLVLNMGLYANPGYRPNKDFVALGVVYTVPYVIVARKDLPHGTLGEIVEAGRAKPGSLNVATAGPGSGQDILASIFASAADITITKVPYRGSAPVYPDLISGRVDLFIDVLSSAQPQVEGGTVRLVATLGPRRSPRAADVPTVREAGLAALTAEQGSWVGLFAPAGVPDPVLRTLRAGIARTVADPSFRQKVEASGGEILEIEGDQAASLVERETARWLPRMENAGIRPQ